MHLFIVNKYWLDIKK